MFKHTFSSNVSLDPLTIVKGYPISLTGSHKILFFSTENIILCCFHDKVVKMYAGKNKDKIIMGYGQNIMNNKGNFAISGFIRFFKLASCDFFLIINRCSQLTLTQYLQFSFFFFPALFPTLSSLLSYQRSLQII